MPTVYVTAPPDAYDDLAAFVRREHPYEEPCIERFDEADVAPSFGEWIRESVDA